MAASALEGSGRVKSDLGKSGQDDSSSPTYVVGNSGPEENNEFLAVFRNPHLKSNIGDSDESQNGVEEVEKAGIPLYLPKIPLYLPKMPFFLSKYYCICPKYHCICHKYHCICHKYHCIYHKYHCICPQILMTFDDEKQKNQQ